MNTRVGPIAVSDVGEVGIDPALASISRVDGDVTITVDADLAVGLAPTAFQPKLIDYANQYQFPSGI